MLLSALHLFAATAYLQHNELVEPVLAARLAALAYYNASHVHKSLPTNFELVWFERQNATEYWAMSRPQWFLARGQVDGESVLFLSIRGTHSPFDLLHDLIAVPVEVGHNQMHGGFLTAISAALTCKASAVGVGIKVLKYFMEKGKDLVADSVQTMARDVHALYLDSERSQLALQKFHEDIGEELKEADVNLVDCMPLHDLLHRYLVEASERPDRIIVVGHSLGGALAMSLVAAELLPQPEPAVPVTVYTFGAPNILQRPIRSSPLDNATLRNFVFREDMIPRILGSPLNLTRRFLIGDYDSNVNSSAFDHVISTLESYARPNSSELLHIRAEGIFTSYYRVHRIPLSEEEELMHINKILKAIAKGALAGSGPYTTIDDHHSIERGYVSGLEAAARLSLAQASAAREL